MNSSVTFQNGTLGYAYASPAHLWHKRSVWLNRVPILLLPALQVLFSSSVELNIQTNTHTMHHPPHTNMYTHVYVPDFVRHVYCFSVNSLPLAPDVKVVRNAVWHHNTNRQPLFTESKVYSKTQAKFKKIYCLTLDVSRWTLTPTGHNYFHQLPHLELQHCGCAGIFTVLLSTEK